MRKPQLSEKSHMHMIGVAGAGMSGLAIVMSELGYRVTGSDRRSDPVFEKLRAIGVTAYVGHDAAHVEGADLIVASAAVPDDNPEIKAARAQGIRIVSRAELLGWLMAEEILE